MKRHKKKGATMKANTNSALESRLLSYSLTAGVALLASQHANAQVAGGSFTNKILSTNGDIANINFGGAAFQLEMFSPIVYKTVRLTMPAGNSYLGAATAGDVVGLNAGAVVGSAASPWKNAIANPKVIRTYFGGVTGAGGTFNINSIKYIGVKFKISGSIHYGWIQVQVTQHNPLKLQVNKYAYQQTVGASITCDGITPVELTSFTGALVGSSVSLKWNTATEVNNYGFEVERRVISDKQSAVSSWNKVGFVAGNGTSNSEHSYSYTDNTATAGTFAYRLKQIDNDGTSKYSSETEVTIAIPKSFALNQNYPNPFNPSTVISYDVPAAGTVLLKVHNALGQEVMTLVNETKDAGSYTAHFDASHLPSGMYFAKLTVGDAVKTIKMTLLK